MTKRRARGDTSKWMDWWTVFALLALGAVCAQAQHGPSLGPGRARPVKERSLPGGLPANSSLAPAASIPVDALGFSAPGPLYLGDRDSMASLDFIGEDRLLFTFRVPGLIHREFKDGKSEQSDERQIKAVVLKLPSGAIEAESLWTVHDRQRYLWMMDDGKFLLRDKANLLEGDAQLNLKPYLQFPGLVLRLEVDPTRQYIVSNSLEPVATPAKPGMVGSPSTASATVTTDQQNSDEEQEKYVVRILRQDTGKVMLVSRTRGVVHLPINSEAYVENLRGRENQWVLNLNYFTGGTHILGSVTSNCVPTSEFISNQELLVTGCDDSGALKLVAINTDGAVLWDDLNPATDIWPVLASSSGGKRVAQEMMVVTHPVNAYAPLGSDEIRGQMVVVLDGASGEILFWSPVSPVLDAGGNVAISSSGKRIALMNAGAIQVFELPENLQPPGSSKKQPSK